MQSETGQAPCPHNAGMTNRPCLHFLCGKAGAGKSTLARRLAEQHRAVLVSEDVWLHACSATA